MKITLIGMEQYLNSENDSLFADITLPTSDLIDKDTLVDTIMLDSGEFETLYADPAFMKMATTNFFNRHARTFNKWVGALELEYNPLYNKDYTETETFEDNIAEIHTKHEGERKTTENDGTYTDTTNTGKTKVTESGSSSGTNTGTGSITKPDTTTTTESAAGFHGGTNTMDDAKRTTTKVGNYLNGTFVESSTSSDTVTASNSNDTTTEQLVNGTVTHSMSSPKTIETGHKANQEDTDTFTKNPRTVRGYGNIGVTTSQQMLQSELDIARFDLYKEISSLYMTELTLPVYI